MRNADDIRARIQKCNDGIHQLRSKPWASESISMLFAEIHALEWVLNEEENCE